jgi:hypothetical protein
VPSSGPHPAIPLPVLLPGLPLFLLALNSSSLRQLPSLVPRTLYKRISTFPNYHGLPLRDYQAKWLGTALREVPHLTNRLTSLVIISSINHNCMVSRPIMVHNIKRSLSSLRPARPIMDHLRIGKLLILSIDAQVKLRNLDIFNQNRRTECL